jgi:hypothetical protein
MSDPRRLLDDAGALSPDERRLLEAELKLEVPKDAKKGVLGAVLARLPNGGGEAPGELDPTGLLGSGASGALGASTTAGGAALLAFAKPAAVGFALGVATTVAWVGGRSALERASHSPTPTQTASTSPATKSSAAVPAPGEFTTPPGSDAVNRGSESSTTLPHTNRNEPPLAPTSTSSVVHPSEAPSIRAFPDEPPDGSATSAESQRLAAARTLLRSGNARAALGALERLRADFPRGVLVQERESLEIEALVASGARATAEKRAREFLARYPKSPHAAAARRALER